MNLPSNLWLLAGALFSGIVALLHVGCILFGGPWYRFMGAGERMVRMSDAGYWYPTVVTSLIVCALTVWTLYALSGAGVIAPLPFLRTILFAIGAVYLLRGLGAAALVPYFPGNSLTFWIVTSAVSTFAGVLYVMGARAVATR
jgi:hypothetical protein